MGFPQTQSSIWEDIDRSESYLVCCMFDKATSLSSSVLRKIDSEPNDNQSRVDMRESAGMVLLQSLNESGRASEILKELKTVFGSVTNIPTQVLLTGACFQISDGSYSGLCEFLDDFLAQWRGADGQSYVPLSAEENAHSVLEIEDYLEVVELYTVTLLGGLLSKIDVAIAWVEKAQLPDEKRQDLLRRLRSLYSIKATNSCQNEETAEIKEAWSETGEMLQASKVTDQPNSTKQTLLKLSERVEPCTWWYRTINLKFGSARLVVTHGKIALWGSFVIFIWFLLKKKQTSLKQIVSKQALIAKKALGDLWELAFSVQVNPLAAVQSVQSLPTGTPGNR
ncbi:hypothetical protein ACHQM5_030615 [Ranunculus cassubicifolius]